MSAVITPQEQIRRVARALLVHSDRANRPGSRRQRSDLSGLIAMIDRHLEGELPPIEVAHDPLSLPLPPRSRPVAIARR